MVSALKGENRGKRIEGIQANTVRAFSSNLDVDDPRVILNGNFLCNDLGLDVDGTAVSLGWAFECYEKGIFTDKDTDGLQLIWGNSEAALSMIKAIALRRRIGDLLAEGAARVAEKIGKGTSTFAMHVKGAPINDSNMRTHKGWALGISTWTGSSGKRCWIPDARCWIKRDNYQPIIQYRASRIILSVARQLYIGHKN